MDSAISPRGRIVTTIARHQRSAALAERLGLTLTPVASRSKLIKMLKLSCLARHSTIIISPFMPMGSIFRRKLVIDRHEGSFLNPIEAFRVRLAKMFTDVVDLVHCPERVGPKSILLPDPVTEARLKHVNSEVVCCAMEAADAAAIVALAEQNPALTFHATGFRSPGAVARNVIAHGFIGRDEYRNLLQQCSIALSTSRRNATQFSIFTEGLSNGLHLWAPYCQPTILYRGAVCQSTVFKETEAADDRQALVQEIRRTVEAGISEVKEKICT